MSLSTEVTLVVSGFWFVSVKQRVSSVLLLLEDRKKGGAGRGNWRALLELLMGLILSRPDLTDVVRC